MLDLKSFCKKIKTFVIYYKRLINLYNNTAYNILEKEIKLLLPPMQSKQKFGIITVLVSSFIELAFEGIPNFLITNEIMPYMKLFKLWKIRLIFSAIN